MTSALTIAVLQPAQVASRTMHACRCPDPRRHPRRQLRARAQLDLPARPGRRLLDAAADDRAQPQRLRLGRAQQRRRGPGHRLLLRLSDRLRRPGHEQRPAPSMSKRARSRPSSPASPASAGRLSPLYRQMTLGAVAAAALGSDMRAAGRTRLWRCRQRLADLPRQIEQGPPVRAGRPQPGIADDPGADQAGDRGQAGRPADAARDHPRLQRAGAARQAGRRHLQAHAALLVTPAQTGCVMSWVSFRERNVPPEGALFGFAPPAMTVGCTNPARPGSANWEPLDSYFYTRSKLPVPGGPVQWSSEGAAPTPYVRTEGLVSARCVNDGRLGYLSVRTNADPKDKRTDRIGGEVAVMGMFLPGWGMHLADMYIAQGDLLRSLEELGGAVDRHCEERMRRSNPAPTSGLLRCARNDDRGMTSPLDTPYRGGFVGREHHFALTVYFEDTDTAGIVYYANYLKFMERARSDMIRAAGVDQVAAHLSASGVYAVAEVEHPLPQARPALAMTWSSSARSRQVRGVSVRIHQRVMRGDEQLTDAQVTAAFLTPDGRPQRQPREWVREVQGDQRRAMMKANADDHLRARRAPRAARAASAQTARSGGAIAIAVPPLSTPKNEQTAAGSTLCDRARRWPMSSPRTSRSASALRRRTSSRSGCPPSRKSTAPSYPLWRTTGARQLVTGFVQARPDGRLTVGCYLYDVLSGARADPQGLHHRARRLAQGGAPLRRRHLYPGDRRTGPVPVAHRLCRGIKRRAGAGQAARGAGFRPGRSQISDAPAMRRSSRRPGRPAANGSPMSA